jgi:hypothetical protein
MPKPRLFLCNDSTEKAAATCGKGIIVNRLATYGPSQNVMVQIEDIVRVFLNHLNDRLVDLLEISALVLAADSMAARGSQWTEGGSEEPWQRVMSLRIAVRDHEFWNRKDINKLLSEALNFLSDDQWALEFVPMTGTQPRQEYLQLAGADDWPFYEPERVILFSGGLDSLAGAVSRASAGEKLLLVSHRSVSTMDSRQDILFGQLKGKFSTRMLRVPVWVHKMGSESREFTQRTRSFLFWALGLAVAQSVRSKRITFYENGVVSLNLPVADQVLRARASRTTHPRSLNMFEQLSRLITGNSNLIVENPFVFDTKADIVERIAKLGAGDLIQHTCSCTRTLFQSKARWHCGTCSQCIDRRMAMVATGKEACDPQTDYFVDVFAGPRESEVDRTMALSYVRHAHELGSLGERGMAERFATHIYRAITPFADRRDAARRFLDMHSRHASAVMRALEFELARNGAALVSGEIASTSLLALVAGQRHLESLWTRYAKRLCSILENGVPRSYKRRKPKDEPELQETCDGLFAAANEDLIREYPFMRWGTRMTKPDFADQAGVLWVELKYVRERKEVLRVTEQIATDIVKYGDNQKRVLFVVYDPGHHIVNEIEFRENVEKHSGMLFFAIR